MVLLLISLHLAGSGSGCCVLDETRLDLLGVSRTRILAGVDGKLHQ